MKTIALPIPLIVLPIGFYSFFFFVTPPHPLEFRPWSLDNDQACQHPTTPFRQASCRKLVCRKYRPCESLECDIRPIIQSSKFSCIESNANVQEQRMQMITLGSANETFNVGTMP